MKHLSDSSTLELPTFPKRRGRPPLAHGAMSQAERQRLYRQRHALVPVTVELPADLVEQLAEYLKFKDTTKNAVIEKLLRSQLLRKR